MRGGLSISVGRLLLPDVVTANQGLYPKIFYEMQLLHFVVTAKGWWYKVDGFKKTLTTDDVMY